MSDNEEQLRQLLSMDFRSLGLKSGLSNRELVAVCGVKPDTVKDWKNKNKNALPHQVYLGRLATATGLPFGVAFGKLSDSYSSLES